MTSERVQARPTEPAALAVVIATFNRAKLLRQVLESLAAQTLPSSTFEVIVVDDGSQDDTRLVVESFHERLRVTYAFQPNAGLASARNRGLFKTRSPLLLFLDDDDVASPSLIETHLQTHSRYSADNLAVLGYTKLTPTLAVDPLMHFVTEVGCFLYSYPAIRDGEILGFSHFWGGRTSCKRQFLLEHGVFNPVFRFGCEDIELGFRLSQHQLQVVYNARAITTTIRGISFDGFCERLLRQGRSNSVFSQLHADQRVRRWCQVDDARREWPRIESVYDSLLASARSLDRMARMKVELGFDMLDCDQRWLHEAYARAFRAAKFRGIIEGMQTSAAVTV